VWREVGLRRLKKGESLDFEYTNHHGGVPDAVAAAIKAKLVAATTPEEVKAAFDTSAFAETSAPSDVLELAKAINKLADHVIEKG
jgi:hypothetical protein